MPCPFGIRKSALLAYIKLSMSKANTQEEGESRKERVREGGNAHGDRDICLI
jgi:hypothetical protein